MSFESIFDIFLSIPIGLMVPFTALKAKFADRQRQKRDELTRTNQVEHFVPEQISRVPSSSSSEASTSCSIQKYQLTEIYRLQNEEHSNDD